MVVIAFVSHRFELIDTVPSLLYYGSLLNETH